MTRRTKCLLLGLASTVVLFGRDEYSRSFNETVPWHGGERIYLEHKLGDITIRTHARPEILVHADIRVLAGNKEEAKTFADRVNILIEPSATEVSVRTRYPERHDSLWGMRGISYSVRYDLVVPESAALRVRNSFGRVSVTGLKADSEISTSHGDLEFRDGRGVHRLEDAFAPVRVANNTGNVTVETNNGSVEASGITGELSIRDRFGNIEATRVTNGITISNSNGAVRVIDSGGPGRIRNSFGGVSVQTLRGDLIVNNANGRVDASHVEGRAELNTTFGEVVFSDIKRDVVVTANNSRVEGSRAGGPVTLGTSFAAVTLSDVEEGAKIQSQNGSVTIWNIRGPASVRTSFGMVQASNIGGLLLVGNTNGAVKASNVHGAQITTSFGPVILDGVSGPVQVENRNGSVEAALASKSACQRVAIATSFSPVRLHLNAPASYKVTAQTSFGKIHTDFPLAIEGALSSDTLNGVIGSGTCEMHLTNRNGNIDILK